MATLEETRVRLNVRGELHVAFSPNGQLFAAADEFGFATLRQTSTGNEVATFRGSLQGFHSVNFSPDGKRLAIGSRGKEAIMLWDVESHQELVTLEAEGVFFAPPVFTSDGNVLGALSYLSGVLHLWRAPSWAEIEESERR